MDLFGLKEKNISIKIFKIKTMDKKVKNKKIVSKEQFFSIAEVENEFMPACVAKKKKEEINKIEEERGSKEMSEILSNY